MMGDRVPKQDVYTDLKLATIGSAAQKWRERYARQGKVYLAPRRHVLTASLKFQGK